MRGEVKEEGKTSICKDRCEEKKTSFREHFIPATVSLRIIKASLISAFWNFCKSKSCFVLYNGCTSITKNNQCLLNFDKVQLRLTSVSVTMKCAKHEISSHNIQPAKCGRKTGDSNRRQPWISKTFLEPILSFDGRHCCCCCSLSKSVSTALLL